MNGPVLVDVQATQSASHRDRGVARYTVELANALWRQRPDLVHGFLLNPDLDPPGGVESLVATGRLDYSDRATWEGASLLHLASPVELDAPLNRVWPARAASHGMYLSVTLHDVIPDLFPDDYLVDPGLRRRYRARLELVRAADLVLTNSETTARDGIERLALREERVVCVGGAASAAWFPPTSRTDALVAARKACPGLAEHFVLYTGGVDRRKNFQGLFDGWARVPASLRDTWQLVMVCSMDEPTRNHLHHVARGVGIETGLLLPGYVPDETLRLLCQSTDLFVFPSLYEGFGLPVAEALACGAPTIGSSTSAVAEQLVADARFEPSDPDAIAAAIVRGLTDDAFRARLDEQARRTRPSWDTVANRAGDAFDRLLARPRRKARARPLVAVVTPLPPAPTGVADFSYRLLAELREYCDLHAFADGGRHVAAELGPPRAPDGVEVASARYLAEAERAGGGYDCVVYCLGNSEFHGYALAQLRRRSGVVLAHEVRLTDLYALTADVPGAVPGGTPARVTPEEAERTGVLMAAEVVELADRFAVMSPYAAERVRLELDPLLTGRVTVVPFAGRDVVAEATPSEARGPIVASFGIVNEIKENALLVGALPALVARVPDVSAVLVGPCAEAERDRLVQLAAELGVADRLTITGAVSDGEYDAWLDRAAVAVQLRRSANGECSASIADCLAAGAVSVVTAIGAGRDLPASAVVHVEPSVSPAELAGVIGDLLDDPVRRAAQAEGAREYASVHSYAALARQLFSDVIEPASRVGLSVPRLL